MLERQEFQPAELRTLLKGGPARFIEYGRLGLTLMKLYFQSRILMAQNFILSCRLRMWDAIFVYCKIQIFFIRLYYGFPIGECWPAEKPCRH